MRTIVAAPVALLVTALLLPTGTSAASATYRVDPANSRVTIAVGKAGVFSFVAGHTHEVSGPIDQGTVDVDDDNIGAAHVRLSIPSAALRVSGADEPPDYRPKVQHTMESDQVLDVMRYPRIEFDSTEVTSVRRQADGADANVAGRLTIRDVTRPITAPVHVAFDGRTLTATGRMSIKQTAFGIKPVSVGGVVAVKDTLEMTFTIVARR